MFKKQMSIAETQKLINKVFNVNWTLEDEIKTPSDEVDSSLITESRNKREGQYAGWSITDGKHHRIYHHKKPAGVKCVGHGLLIKIL